MGKPLKRVSPKITSFVNRNIDDLAIKQLHKVVMKLDCPYLVDKRGNKYPPQLTVMCLVLKIFFVESYEGIEARLKNNSLLKQLFNVDKLPSHSTIHEAMSKTSMKYLRKVFRRLIYKLNKKKKLVVDATGFSTRTSSAWYDIRIQRKNKRRDCIKLHALIDIETGQILEVRITDFRKHDCPLFRRLMKDIFNVDKVAGDPAYLSKKNCEIIATKGGIAFFLPKKNVRVRARGSKAWKVMIVSYKKDKENWLKQYHIRSFIEAVFSSIKRRWRSILLSIKKLNRRKELFLKTLCYNLKELLYLLRADKLGISKWKTC